jgi:hypothetical protein
MPPFSGIDVIPYPGRTLPNYRYVAGHVRQRGGNSGIFERTIGHAAMLAILVGAASISGGKMSAITSVCIQPLWICL